MEDQGDTRGVERESSRGSRAGGWIAGAILIVVGIVFLLQNLGVGEIRFLQNWWALFILIPAVGSLITAWRNYQTGGMRFTRATSAPFFGGMALLFVALIFLFNLDWGIMWPVFLLIAGVSVLVGALLK